MPDQEKKTVIFGAGLVGSLLGVYLSRHGYKVDIYERRPDMRKADIPAGRSINLALSDRGWKALEGAGLADAVKKTAVPMYGRMMHDEEGNLTEQPYGKPGQAIYSVSRGDLNELLINEADKNEDVNLFFNERCLSVDLKNSSASTLNTETDKETTLKADLIFGADGAFSAVRGAMQITDRFNYSQHYLPHGYKELTIPAGENGAFQLQKNYLHIWPRKDYMLIALPNADGSFTCTLFLSFEGEISFKKLQTETDVRQFFNTTFPDAVPLMPTLTEDFFSNPTSSLVTVRCYPWVYNDTIALIGDAAHAIVPFYGQGMNAGFEDCSVLNEIITRHNKGDWKSILTEYQQLRKPDGDAIADLALQNFIEMRDLVGNEEFLLRKKVSARLHELFPDRWNPIYSMVTFSHLRYSEARQQGKSQDTVLQKIMAIKGIEKLLDQSEFETITAPYLNTLNDVNA